MFEAIPLLPPDPILGLTEAVQRDPRPHKINLSVGVYRDDRGQTPVLRCVKVAEQRLLESEATKLYLPIEGLPTFNRLVPPLLLGDSHPAVTENRCATVQTPGGTGALRVAADFVKRNFPRAQVWHSDPTWPNHPQIFSAAGVSVRAYAYYDATRREVDFARLVDSLQQIPAGDVLLLHPSCHNPTGADPTAEQWRTLADIAAERRLIPLLDFAYQGFGSGLAEDAEAVRQFCRPGMASLICSSFSKNFALYNERVGALTAVVDDPAQVEPVMSQLKAVVRSSYSNPPAHGAQIVATVLSDPSLRQQWYDELRHMRERIQLMRSAFARTMSECQTQRDFSFIQHQRGMFSFSGLTPVQVQQLREQHAIYMVNNGRINVAGMSGATMAPLCQAIAAVL